EGSPATATTRLPLNGPIRRHWRPSSTSVTAAVPSPRSYGYYYRKGAVLGRREAAIASRAMAHLFLGGLTITARRAPAPADEPASGGVRRGRGVVLPRSGRILSPAEIMADYRVVFRSREVSRIGRREVLSGNAKFGA